MGLCGIASNVVDVQRGVVGGGQQVRRREEEGGRRLGVLELERGEGVGRGERAGMDGPGLTQKQC